MNGNTMGSGSPHVYERKYGCRHGSRMTGMCHRGEGGDVVCAPTTISASGLVPLTASTSPQRSSATRHSRKVDCRDDEYKHNVRGSVPLLKRQKPHSAYVRRGNDVSFESSLPLPLTKNTIGPLDSTN